MQITDIGWHQYDNELEIAFDNGEVFYIKAKHLAEEQSALISALEPLDDNRLYIYFAHLPQGKLYTGQELYSLAQAQGQCICPAPPG